MHYPLNIPHLTPRHRNALCLILYAVCVLSGVLCQKTNQEESPPRLPDEIVKNFILYETMSGKSLYILTADEAKVFESEGCVAVTHPRIIFYDENQTPTAVLTAITGVMWTKTQDLVARDSVRVETPDSTILLTDSLMWSNARRQILTQAQVTIVSPKGTILGQGLISDAGLKRIEVQSEIRGSSNYEFPLH